MAKLNYIESAVVDDVAIITFSRPKHNVMNISMMKEINSELESILKNDALKCLVFEAKGLSWCAGVEVSEHKPDMVSEMISIFGRMFELIHSLEIPTIAAVYGSCLGGGMEIAIACDIIIASNNAVFGQPEVKLGFFPPYAVVKLPSLVGQARAIEICTTGKRYSAVESLEMGMISKVVDNDKSTITTEIENILKEIRACSPIIIRLNKRAIMKHLGMNLDEAFSEANSLFLGTLMNTKDVLEGINSFEEKRKPVWVNQ